MVDQTIKVNRNELQAVFKNPRLVRAIEDLIQMTQDILPDQVLVLTIAIQEAAQTADGAAASAATANAIAAQALNQAKTSDDGPLPFYIPPPHSSDDAIARVAHLESVVASLSRRVSNLEESPTP